MKPIASTLLFALLASSSPPPSPSPSPQSAIGWSAWSEDAFTRAQRENRFVILYLEAVWCHWCHVMDHETYGDARVQELLEARFVPVRVDSDARPDLALRYKRYGWPATIIFAADGTELVKRRGFIEADDMIALLEKITVHPVPEKETASGSKDQVAFAGSPILPKDIRERLLAAHRKAQDAKLGGLKSLQKFLDHDSAEYAIVRSIERDPGEEKAARRTIAASLALVDPAWGGVYQYSTHGDWNHPHFEKIMSTQAGALRIYTLAWTAWKDQRALAAAKSITRYVRTFLRDPSGAFWTSQDADLVPGEHADKYFALSDGARRKKGLPKIDRHIYARENGWMIEALAEYAAATKDPLALEDAILAARAVARARSFDEGGFRHDQEDAGGPYLGDTLAMGRAFLALYEATQDRDDLTLASRAGEFIAKRFGSSDAAGFTTAASPANTRLPLTIDLDENISAARFFNRLQRYTGNRTFRAQAERAMRYLATPSVTASSSTEPGVLLADRELAADPLHVTVVGSRKDQAARALFESALQIPSTYRRIEWWDPGEGPLPNPDVAYPVLKKPAAFVCTAGACSTPIFGPKDVADAVRRISAR